jgi:hypothetical protein
MKKNKKISSVYVSSFSNYGFASQMWSYSWNRSWLRFWWFSKQSSEAFSQGNFSNEKSQKIT